MPSVRKVVPVSIHISDLHLSERVPAARGESPSEWMDVQADYLNQVGALSRKLGGVPVVIAGDIFDRWDSPASLINFTIVHIHQTRVYAIPGNHDLPNHSLKEIKRSAYWTLVEAGAIRDIDTENQPIILMGSQVFIHGFPCGVEVTPLPQKYKRDDYINVAVVHDYVWTSDVNKYVGAPEEKQLGRVMDRFAGYDFVHLGDNHTPFAWVGESGNPTVFNPGTFIRRKRDEMMHTSRVGILYSDGSLVLHTLDTSKDKWAEPGKEIVAESDFDSQSFLEELSKLQDASLNFEEAVRRHLKSYPIASELVRLTLKHLERGR